MEIVTILSDKNHNYPFSKDISEQYDVIYHGTNSNFAKSIEKYGWYENSQPYDLNDITYLCDIYNNFFFNDEDDEWKYNTPNQVVKLHEYYWTLTLFTLRSSDSSSDFKKENCFTDDYEKALIYASYLHGETLEYVFLFIDEFINVLNSPINPDVFKVICSIEDKANIILNLNNIKNKYINLVSNSYPVIYAIKGRNEWFDSVNLDSRGLCTNLDLKTTAHISPDSILGKVEFLNGVKIP